MTTTNQPSISFDGLVIYKPAKGGAPYAAMASRGSSAASLALVHSSTGFIINCTPGQSGVSANTTFHSFWLGEDEWLADSTAITANDNGCILVTVDAALSHLDVPKLTDMVQKDPQIIEMLGGAEAVRKAVLRRRPPDTVVTGADAARGRQLKPRFFVSYRRSDSAIMTGRICDRLISHFGKASIFMDITTIPPGVDFRDYIVDSISQCHAALVIIGDTWLTAEHKGKRRLEDTGDFVRIEVETSLKQGIPVIPVLVGRTVMPAAEELPTALSNLAFRNAVAIDPGIDFHPHMDRLIASLEQLLEQAPVK